MGQNETWHGDRPCPGHTVLDGDLAPQRGHSPNYRPMSILAKDWMDQDATWYEGSLGPGDIVLDGDPAPPPQKIRGTAPPISGPCLLWPNGWMDQDATWYRGGPQLRPHYVRWGHSPPFLAHVCCGQTVAHLSYCWARTCSRSFWKWLLCACLDASLCTLIFQPRLKTPLTALQGQYKIHNSVHVPAKHTLTLTQQCIASTLLYALAGIMSVVLQVVPVSVFRSCQRRCTRSAQVLHSVSS